VTGTPNGGVGQKHVSDKPMEIFRIFEKEGAEIISIFDLDANQRKGDNNDTIYQVGQQTNMHMHVCGGVRGVGTIQALMLLGGREKTRVGISADSASDPELIKKLTYKIEAGDLGRENLTLFIDLVDGRMLTKGMVKEYWAIDFANEYNGMFGYVAFRDVKREFRMEGVDTDFFTKAARDVDYPVIASGGIGQVDDLKGLRDADVYGAIVGKALYEGRIKLEEAIGAVR
jgi:phosphoribosylformimino-5-aminoimidazole carboxamide ribotide isomerase